jgi:hypothetical protein
LVGTEATTGRRLFANWRWPRHLRFAAARLVIAFLAYPLALATSSAGEISPDPVEVSGNLIHRWQVGGADASLLEGDCILRHRGKQVSADSMLLLVDGPVGHVRSRVVVAGLREAGAKAIKPQVFTFETLSEPKIQASLFRGKPKQQPTLLSYLPDDAAQGSETSPIQQAQFAETIVTPPAAGPAPITLSDGATTGGVTFMTGGGTRSVEIRARGASRPPVIESINRPDVGETVILARGGVTVLIRDVTAQLPSGELMELGTISLSANRVVGWLPLVSGIFNGTADLSQSDGELYLEGDIVFRQGQRIIYAESMYYNVNAQRGVILNAEAITTIPEYQGIVRLKADVMQQISRGKFIAFDAAVTSSRMGVPRYWLQSQRLQLTDRERIVQDALTGVPVVESQPYVESQDNFVYVGGVPVFYWPRLATSLERPTSYVSGIGIKNDDIFGTQILLDFDLFQLFGIENAPKGADWELSIDYLSKRGPAIGTTLDYSLPGLMGIPGPVNGFFDTWVMHDRGLDTLGRDRINLKPEKSTRGRSLLRHRHYLPNDYELIGEIGWISDRNFLESYLENEWDQELDHRTGLRLRKYINHQMLDLSLNAQANDFFTTTEQLPRLDHWLIGGSLLGDRLTWSAHSNIGYSRLRVGDLPNDPSEAAEYSPTPGEINSKGVVASTRHELSLPLQLGVLKVIPNVSGEVSYYGEAADGESLTRLLGQAGIRTSLSAWRVDPTIQSSLLNVRGLAHKVEWTAEYFYADSDTNLDQLPLYDPLDDHAQQQFRSRFITANYGGTLPDQFDPRTYAFRQGFQQLVASPSNEIADDLQLFRFGLHQRWQTKRGLPGRERIVDLFRLNIDASVFPKDDRDNFGKSMGPATYDLEYNVGDRVSLLSDGYIDFFSGGLRSISAGVRSSRPGLGEVYLGLMSLEGPISSTVLRSTVDYRMNEKWIASAGTTYDFGQTGNVGQTLGITRIGESMLLRLGINVDRGRDNVGIGFGIEPRFWPKPRLGRVGGQLIPPPGVEGLE